MIKFNRDSRQTRPICLAVFRSAAVAAASRLRDTLGGRKRCLRPRNMELATDNLYLAFSSFSVSAVDKTNCGLSVFGAMQMAVICTAPYCPRCRLRILTLSLTLSLTLTLNLILTLYLIRHLHCAICIAPNTDSPNSSDHFSQHV